MALQRLERNEQNVMWLFTECRATPETPKPVDSCFYSNSSKRFNPDQLIAFDRNMLWSHSDLIRYWMEQIKGVHQDKRTLITSDGLFHYKGERWVKDKDNTPVFAPSAPKFDVVDAAYALKRLGVDVPEELLKRHSLKYASVF